MRLGWGHFIRWLNPRVEARHYHRHAGPWPDVRRTPWLQWTASPPTVADLDRDGRDEVIGVPNVERGIPYRDDRLCVRGARRRPARRRTVGSPAPRLRNSSTEPQAGLPSRRRLVPPIGHPGADRRRHRPRPPPRNRGRRARRLRLRGRARRAAALALRLRPRTREDVRLRGGGRRPEPRRTPRARLRHLRTEARRGSAGGAIGRRSRGSTTGACAARAATATASAFPRRRRSPIWTETGDSRSWCRRSTTGSTSSASRDPGPTSCRGRPVVAACWSGAGSATAR